MSTPNEPQDPGRRGMLGAMMAMLGTLATFGLGAPILGYLLAPIIRPKKNQWIDVGAVDDFTPGETRLVDMINPDTTRAWDGDTAKMAAYVRRVDETKFLTFAINCAHLGCPVAWFAESGLFLCPCHGGVYYEDGARASGPPPRGLYEYEHQIVDGRLQIKAGIMPTMYQPV